MRRSGVFVLAVAVEDARTQRSRYTTQQSRPFLPQRAYVPVRGMDDSPAHEGKGGGRLLFNFP